MLVGNLRWEFDDTRQTGLHVRTLIAVHQVLMITMILTMHQIFVFFLRILKKDPVEFVLVSYKKEPHVQPPVEIIEQPPQGNMEFANGFSEVHTEVDKPVYEEVHGESGNYQNTNNTNKCFSETQSIHTHTSSGTRKVFSQRVPYFTDQQTEDHSESMSIQSIPHLNIVFETSINLDLYVLYVNLIGLVLWDTFVCFNFATFDSNFVIVCGMVGGWVCNSFSKECRCYGKVAPGQKVLVLFYSFMFVLIISLAASKWEAAQDLTVQEQLNLYIPAFCSGVFWTAISTEVAFTDIVHGNVDNPFNSKISRGILYDAKRALPTFLLVMCVSALYSSPETRNDVQEYLRSLSRLSTLHVLLVEPILIFASLYVMIISFEKQRATDFILSMVLVQGLSFVYRDDVYDPINAALMASCVLLLSVHVTRLLRS
jgi:hypothetical protein